MSPVVARRQPVFLLRLEALGSFFAVRKSAGAGCPRGATAGLLVVAVVGLGGCVSAIESAPPIRNPAEVAAALRGESDTSGPVTLRFEWRYADRRGDVGGQGVGRYNPPDSLRVDLFTSGDVAMAIAVAGGQLRSLGEIEDIEIPGLEFVYAMAGLFRPGEGAAEGYLSGADSVLVYGGEADRRTYFFVRNGRLRRVEERVRGRTVQRVNLEWEREPAWPSQAEYRNLSEHSRVRWRVDEIVYQEESHPAQAYDLPPVP